MNSINQSEVSRIFSQRGQVYKYDRSATSRIGNRFKRRISDNEIFF